MKRWLDSLEVTLGVAFFSLLFGAGNLLMPLQIGIITDSGSVIIGILPFLVTAVVIPFLTFVAAFLAQGNYSTFFQQLGHIPGRVLLFISMLIIGPAVAMPRLVATTYLILEPLLHTVPLCLFSIFFLCGVFVCALHENKVTTILETVTGPLLLAALATIIIKGMLLHPPLLSGSPISAAMVLHNLCLGALTIDVWKALFFTTALIHILHENGADRLLSTRTRTMIMLKSGLIGSSLLTIMYGGLSFLGAYYGPYINTDNTATFFSTIIFSVCNIYFATFMSLCIACAFFSMLVTLARFATGYFHQYFFPTISYRRTLCITLSITALIANLGLNAIMHYSTPLALVCFPIIVFISIGHLIEKFWNMPRHGMENNH